MKVNTELMLNRRTIESKRKMRRLAMECQTVGLIALYKKACKRLQYIVDGVLYHKCW